MKIRIKVIFSLFQCLARPRSNNWEENTLQRMRKWWRHKMAATASCDVTGVKCFINSPDTVYIIAVNFEYLSMLKLRESMQSTPIIESYIECLNVITNIVTVVYCTTVESVVFCCISCTQLTQASILLEVDLSVCHESYYTTITTDRYCKRCVLGNNIFCPLIFPLSTISNNSWNYSINRCNVEKKGYWTFSSYVYTDRHYNVIEAKNVPINI